MSRFRELRSVATLAAFFLLAFTAIVPGQQPPQPIFRSGVEVVEVAAVVADRDGRPVRGLTAGDFEILEDKVRQKIEMFQSVDIPIPLDARGQPSAAFPLDVATNHAASEGRLFVIVLDDLHIDATLTPRTRHQVRQFIEEFVGPSDLAMIVPTGGNSELVQDFTSDKARLIRAIDRFSGQKPPPGGVSLPTVPGMQSMSNARSALEQKHDARVALQVIGRLAQHLTAAHRRVAVLLFTQGFALHALGENASTEVTGGFQDAINMLTRGNTVLYLVDPAGLTPDKSDLFDNLRALATETGGFAAVSMNDYSEAFGRMVRENSVFYVLGYYPSRNSRPGEVRLIDVRVPGRDVRVSARKAHAMPRNVRHARERPPSGVPQRLAEVLMGPLPVDGLPLRAQGLAFREGAKTRVRIVLEIAGDGLQFTPVKDRFSDRIEIAFMTTDAEGRRGNGTFTAAELTLTEAERDRVRSTGFRWLSTVALEPGRYQLRIAASSTGSGRTGLVFVDLDVPETDSNRLGMSDVAITSLTTTPVLTRGSAGPASTLPAPPTAVRRFAIGETLSAGFEVYPPRNRSLTVTVTARVEGADGVERLTESRTIPSQQKSQGTEVVFRIPTEALTPGWYVWRVTSQSPGQDQVQQVVTFEIIS